MPLRGQPEHPLAPCHQIAQLAQPGMRGGRAILDQRQAKGVEETHLCADSRQFEVPISAKGAATLCGSFPDQAQAEPSAKIPSDCRMIGTAFSAISRGRAKMTCPRKPKSSTTVSSRHSTVACLMRAVDSSTDRAPAGPTASAKPAPLTKDAPFHGSANAKGVLFIT